MINLLNPVVKEGIRRSFSRIDVQKTEFREKAENMICELLRMQFKDVIKEWKNPSSALFLENAEKVTRTEVFDKMVEELLAEFELTVMGASENKELAKNKISEIRINLENDVVARLLKKSDKDIYVEYLKYKRIERNKEKSELEDEVNKAKEEVNAIKGELSKAEEKVAMQEQRMTTYDKAGEQQTADYMERDLEDKERLGLYRKHVELLKLKLKNTTEILTATQKLYDIHIEQSRIEEIMTEAEMALYTGVIEEENLESAKETETENEIENEQEWIQSEISVKESTSTKEVKQPTGEESPRENLETNLIFKQMQEILERSRQANTPEELIEVSKELAKAYLDNSKGDNNLQKEIIDFLGKIPQGKGVQLLGLFFLNGRRKYMQVTGKDNLTKEDKQFIELMKNERNRTLKYLQERFVGQKVNVLPLQTEEEYFEELKSIEVEMIKEERNTETKKHFISGKKGNYKEDKDREDIAEKMMQMYLELSEVTDVTKTNNIQRVYNRIIRKLGKIPDIDDSKIPPTLKERVVQKVKTPLPSHNNMIRDGESRENIGESGPLIE